MPRTTPASPEVKEFLRNIGRKGGIKSGQHPNRTQLNREAAIIRWRKAIPAPKPVEK